MNSLTIAQRLIVVCWLIFLLYWFVSAGTVKPIQRTSGWLWGNWYQILLFLGWLLIFDPFGLARVNPIAFSVISPTLTGNLVSVILVIGGLIVALIARRTLAGNWSRAVAIKEGHELITTGLYRHIRNPIYSGILLMTLGTTLSFGSLSACIGFLVVTMAIYLKLRGEEHILSVHFGSVYLSYKKRSKMLIPFVW